MKKLLLLLLLLVPLSAQAQYTKLVDVEAFSTDDMTVTTGEVNSAGGNLIVCGVADAATNAGVVTDSKSNSYTRLNEYENVTTNLRNALFYVYAPIVGAAHTFTYQVDGGATASFPALGCIVFSGSITSPLDQQNGSTLGNTGTATTTGSVTPTENNELIVTVNSYWVFAGTGSTAPNQSVIQTADIDAVTGQNFALGLGYKIQTTAAAINVTWTHDDTSSDNSVAAIATFKAGTASPCRGALSMMGVGGC